MSDIFVKGMKNNQESFQYMCKSLKLKKISKEFFINIKYILVNCILVKVEQLIKEGHFCSCKWDLSCNS